MVSTFKNEGEPQVNTFTLNNLHYLNFLVFVTTLSLLSFKNLRNIFSLKFYLQKFSKTK